MSDLLVQGVAVLLIAIMFLITSLVALRKSHEPGNGFATHFGAFLYGAVLGGCIMLLILPARMAVADSGADPADSGAAAQSMLIRILPVILIARTEILSRLPAVGRFFRAYRTAQLRKGIESAEKRLLKLSSIGTKKSDHGDASEQETEV